MKWSTMAMSSILISASWTCFHPAMAQPWRHEQGHPGGAMHPGNGGMQMHPHIQQQMQQQHQMQQHQMQMYQQQMQHAQKQYENDAKEFNQFRKANGGGTSQLPNNPQAFQNWAANQKKAKAQGKSYDPTYDQYVKFAKSKGWLKSDDESGHSQSAAQGKGKKGHQSGAEGSTANSSATRKDGANHDARSAAAEKKREEVKREEHRLAEARRLEAARRASARTPLAADGVTISMIRNVHSKLQRANADYNGQRLHAMDSLSQALHHLGTSAPASLGSVGGNMVQTQSDGVLREAIGHLRNVETRLGGMTTNAPHHAQARASVSQAIHHLELALRIR
jgi:hypothetical protein